MKLIDGLLHGAPVQSYSCSLCVIYMALVVDNDDNINMIIIIII